jgi:spermidine synthase
MKSKNELLYYTTCFTTGFAILVFELLSFRMLAPYFGNSSIVIGTIINSILLALAVGYYLGGYIADKKKSNTLIYHVIIISSFYMLCVYLTYPVFLKNIAGLPVIAGTLLAVIILFFLPMILLSFVPPYLIKVISSKDDIGISSGKIFSLSTLGSIVGGIFTTFFFIPVIGTKISILISCIMLFLIGVFGLGRLKLLPLSLIFIIAAPLALTNQSEANIIYTDESVYNIISVEQDGIIFYLRLNDNIGHHSVYIKGRGLTTTYTDIHLFPHMLMNAKKTLILGNASGTMMTQISHFFDRAIDGVEIDDELTRIGLKYFGLTLDGTKKVFHEDARVFLQKNKEKYDIIHVDLYAGNPYIPFHLSTVEFFKLVDESLSDNGIVVVNYPKFLEKNEELSKYYLGTMMSVFPSTFISNEALFAFKTPTSVLDVKKAISAQKFPNELIQVAQKALSKLKPVDDQETSAFFTDDYAPIELMTFNALKR